MRLLLVEDNQVYRKVTGLILKKQFGETLEINTCASLKEAIDLEKEKHHDAVLLDLELPDSRGLETIEKMVESAPQSAVIALTGSDAGKIGLEAVKKGAQDFLEKDKVDGPRLEHAIRFALERSEMLKMISHLAVKDSLCNIYNRRGFTEAAENLLEKCALEDRLFLAVLDLDHFKAVNDTYGHAAGDHMLQFFCDQLRGCARPDMISGRMGGDEFFVIGSEGNAEESEVLNYLKRIGVAVEAGGAHSQLAAPIRFSAGYVIFKGKDAQKYDLKELQGFADKALYIAKEKAGDLEQSGNMSWHGGGVDELSEMSARSNSPFALKRIHWPVGKALLQICKWQDRELWQHQRTVGLIARAMAEALGLERKTCEGVFWGGQLHDIGKLGIPMNLLSLPRKFTDEEFDEVKLHVELGAALFVDFHSPKSSIPESVVRYHHERWDGSGYPDNLKGREIPLPARIVAVADSFDAMTCETRSYREPLSDREAVEVLAQEADKLFDPDIVEVFVNLHGEGLIEDFRAKVREEVKS